MLPPHAAFLATSLAEYMQLDHASYSEECPICRDTFCSPIETPCGHIFCRECFERWAERSASCPSCRAELFDKDTIPPHWPAGVDEFDFAAHFDFEVDIPALLPQVQAFHRISEGDDPFDVELQTDLPIRIDSSELFHAALAGIVCMHSDTKNDDEYSDENREAYCKDFVDAARRINTFLSAHHGELMTLGELEACLEKKFLIYEEPAEEDSSEGDEELGGEEEEEEKEETNLTDKQIHEANAWISFKSDVELIIDYVCHHASEACRVDSG